MPHEIEAKYRLDSFAAIRKLLRQAGAELIQSVEETDQFFDTPGATLLRADCGLRIRTTRLLPLRGAAKRRKVPPLVTYKGPRDKASPIKVRLEVQTHVEDAAALAEILAALGYRPGLVVRKRRTSYRLGRCRVELDDLPGLGKFVEVEGPTQAAVQRACRRIGLDGESITRSYVSMVAGQKSSTS